MEHKTGLEDRYVLKNNKRLRCGYTTGTCAAAAAKAAAVMLFTKRSVKEVDIVTPDKTELNLLIEDAVFDDTTASCAVRKDGGDDPDATSGLLVYAKVNKTEVPGIVIDGGAGVGRVTREGLWQKVGEAAINRVPREMITLAVQEVCEEMDHPGGMKVVISVPKGEETAKKTFNPRLGIEGGISILGTSGIVVPMSEEALIASIRLEMETKKAAGEEYLLITPGNYGEDFLRTGMDIDRSMKCSNFVGETIDMAVELGFKGILFVAHIGKFIKVSGGIMNTHSRCADSRAELMAAHAVRAGAGMDSVQRILGTITTEEAIDILQEEALVKDTMEIVADRIYYYLQHRCAGGIQTEAIIFSNKHGYLGETKGAEELLRYFEQEI
ncbi:MAG: cobalt-precorrin-5B (C(1))-methyltransferase CbiD [Eubacteriales bacterium]|nr:cobalt-precorrin-5B (C(1))-methyltransferase CbiD [Eubacteriales bacterium]